MNYYIIGIILISINDINISKNEEKKNWTKLINSLVFLNIFKTFSIK